MKFNCMKVKPRRVRNTIVHKTINNCVLSEWNMLQSLYCTNTLHAKASGFWVDCSINIISKLSKFWFSVIVVFAQQVKPVYRSYHPY